MYLDTHVHFWKPSRGDYGWLKPDNPLLYQDYLPERLLPELQAFGVDRLIAVQAAPTAEEAAFLLKLAETAMQISGVVGGLDPFAEHFRKQLDTLCAHPRFVGIRIGGSSFREDRPGAERIKLQEALRSLAAGGRVLDLLVRPNDLSAVADYLEQVPELKAVVNHLGVPNVKEQPTEPWRSGMERLSRLPGAAVKLSGMITMAGGPRTDLLRPYVDDLFRMFGCERLVFGSDWPVALQAGSYGEVVELFESLLPDTLTNEEKRKVRMENGRRIYGIDLTGPEGRE